MTKLLGFAMVFALAVVSPAAWAAVEETDGGGKKKMSAAEKRAEIDRVAREALDEVLAKSERGKDLYGQAAGWAVFDNMRITFLLTGGGGTGVAVNKASGKRTYMKMGTGGLALGIGAQKYQVVMFFENQDRFTRFIEHGWKAEAGADAAAGQKGAGAGTTFLDGIAVFKITQSGLIASADISGTKYSVSKKLNP